MHHLMVHSGRMNGRQSAVIEALEQAKTEAWSALWKHIVKRGDADTRQQLWRDYDLAATTLHGERMRRFEAVHGPLSFNAMERAL